jgi:L-alanine-DL-glutamate epimerase-like enolase superfamily enzyme
MKISAVRVTPIAIKDPALLNAAGVHEPFGLRSIIEVVGSNGMVGLGEGIPLVELLGGTVRDKVAYSAYLFYNWDANVDPEYAPDPYGEAVNPAQIVAQAKKMIDQYGFESIKLKAGVFPPDEDADAIKALKAAFPNHQLRIDPNGNWSVPTSIRIAKRLANDLEYYEDPTPGLGVELNQAKLAELDHAFLNCRIRTRNDVTQMQKFRPDWTTVKPRY